MYIVKTIKESLTPNDFGLKKRCSYTIFWINTQYCQKYVKLRLMICIEISHSIDIPKRTLGFNTI